MVWAFVVLQLAAVSGFLYHAFTGPRLTWGSILGLDSTRSSTWLLLLTARGLAVAVGKKGFFKGFRAGLVMAVGCSPCSGAAQHDTVLG